MRSTTALDSKPRPRSRRTPIATLFALLALAAAQAVAPAAASATLSQSNASSSCAAAGGVWSAEAGGCVVSDGSGGWVVLGGEIVPVSGESPPACVFCNPPQRIGDGPGRGGDTPKRDPKARAPGEIRPASKGKKSKGKPKKAVDPVECRAIDGTIRSTVGLPPACDVKLRSQGDPCGLKALLKATDRYLRDWEQERSWLEREIAREKRRGVDPARIFEWEQDLLAGRAESEYLRKRKAEFDELGCASVDYGFPYVHMPDEGSIPRNF
jgi:hypothetical protein